MIREASNVADRLLGGVFARQTAPMGARYTVHGETERECQQALDDLCRLLGTTVTLLPTDRLGRSWIARAERKEAPDHEARGFAVR